MWCRLSCKSPIMTENRICRGLSCVRVRSSICSVCGLWSLGSVRLSNCYNEIKWNFWCRLFSGTELSKLEQTMSWCLAPVIAVPQQARRRELLSWLPACDSISFEACRWTGAVWLHTQSNMSGHRRHFNSIGSTGWVPETSQRLCSHIYLHPSSANRVPGLDSKQNPE